ncbi:MAG: glycosyltransferase family 4 protein [Armatimonadetes bacterium]|nr:glycosyltransferase family 4 protein [Armatimonadota bacterium]
MKIAILGTKGIPATWGGIERHVEELASRFVRMGHDVTVYCRPYYTTSSDEFYNGIRIRKLPTIKLKNYDAITHTFLATLHLLNKDYDIVHYHAIGPAGLSIIPRLLGKKTVATVHGLDWQREKWGRRARTYLKLSERAVVWFPHATIAVSRFLKDYLEKKYKRPVNYIPSAVSDPVVLKPSAIRSYGLEGGDYILFVARLVPEKGCHFLIDAFKQLKTDKKLVVAGGSSHSDRYVNELRETANDRVVFTGYVYGDELHELYSNAYCYVQPSTIEGMPITLLEAVAYGRCVVASDIPPNLEVVKDTGVIFESKNVEDLRGALQSVIDNPDLAAELGRKTQAMGLAEYSYDSIAVKTAMLYAAVAAGRVGLIEEIDPVMSLAPKRGVG